MSRRTPLHEVHVGLGATLTEFAGWTMPVRYRSDLAEHHAVRERAGLFDLSHMGEIEVRGPGAAAALDHALVGELSSVAVGRAKYSMLCARDGGILDDVVTYRRDHDRYLVVANAGNTTTVLRELTERSTGFDAEVLDRSDATALIALQGPAAAAVLRDLGVDVIDDLRYYAGVEVVMGGRTVWLARTGYTGEDGFEAYVDTAGAQALWSSLLEAGRDAGVEPAGLACRDTLRLEAGMPLYGHELTSERTPFDAGFGRIVALGTHRSFVGREALEEIAARPPRERLVGLLAAGRRSPRAGHVVSVDGREVGVVTSGALSPTLGVPIAMAYVDAAVADPGTAATVDVRGTAVAAEIVELPFYRRAR